jgi:hypothetical protein
MVCPTIKLIASSVILSLSSAACSHQGPGPDAFCVLYEQVISEAGDATIVARPSVKRRILKNEKLYRTCPQLQ